VGERQQEFNFSRAWKLGTMERADFPKRVQAGNELMVTSNVKHLLQVLDSFARDEPRCVVRIVKICERMDKSRRTVCRAISAALALDVLIVDKTKNAYGQGANEYQIVWGSLALYSRTPCQDGMPPMPGGHAPHATVACPPCQDGTPPSAHSSAPSERNSNPQSGESGDLNLELEKAADTTSWPEKISRKELRRYRFVETLYRLTDWKRPRGEAHALSFHALACYCARLATVREPGALFRWRIEHDNYADIAQCDEEQARQNRKRLIAAVGRAEGCDL